MNVAEMCGLRVYRVNLSDTAALIDGELIPGRYIAVRENYYEGRYGSLKTSKRRRNVPIPPVLFEKLRALCQGKGPEDAVFANQTGKRPIDAHNVTNRLFNKLRRKPDPNAKSDGIPRLGINVNWHRFRHSQATFAHYLGADDDTRKQMLGHGSTKTTERYTHAEQRQQEIAERIEERLLGATGTVQ